MECHLHKGKDYFVFFFHNAYNCVLHIIATQLNMYFNEVHFHTIIEYSDVIKKPYKGHCKSISNPLGMGYLPSIIWSPRNLYVLSPYAKL